MHRSHGHQASDGGYHIVVNGRGWASRLSSSSTRCRSMSFCFIQPHLVAVDLFRDTISLLEITHHRYSRLFACSSAKAIRQVGGGRATATVDCHRTGRPGWQFVFGVVGFSRPRNFCSKAFFNLKNPVNIQPDCRLIAGPRRSTLTNGRWCVRTAAPRAG